MGVLHLGDVAVDEQRAILVGSRRHDQSIYSSQRSVLIYSTRSLHNPIVAVLPNPCSKVDSIRSLYKQFMTSTQGVVAGPPRPNLLSRYGYTFDPIMIVQFHNY